MLLRCLTATGCDARHEQRAGVKNCAWIHHGFLPWQRANKTVRDTAYPDIGVIDALDYIARLAPNEGSVEMGDNCHPFPSRAPQTIEGTRLDVEFPKPPYHCGQHY